MSDFIKIFLNFAPYKYLYATFCVIRLGTFKMNKLIAFALIAAVSCNDLVQGPEGGRKIYDENKEASPAIWKQKSEVTIKANDTDVISQIVITDLRPDKDGEAQIIDGGEGQKNVTVELKSPTILRGFYFHIEVYVVSEDEQQSYPKSATTELLYPEEVAMFTEQIPVMENDTKVNDGETTQPDMSATEATTALIGDKVLAPADRKTRDTDATVDPTVHNDNNMTGHFNQPHNQLIHSPQETKHNDNNKREDETVTPMHPLVFKELKTNQAASTTEPGTHDETTKTMTRPLTSGLKQL